MFLNDKGRITVLYLRYPSLSCYLSRPLECISSVSVEDDTIVYVIKSFAKILYFPFPANFKCLTGAATTQSGTLH